jgi:tetratricopeptide (TPR) repeat protein
VGRSRKALDALDRYSEGRERLEVPVQIRVEITRAAALAQFSAAEAEALLRSQLERLGTLPQPQRFRWIEGDARMVLGRLLTQGGRSDAAAELLGPVVQWRTEDLSSTSALLAESQVALAESRLRQGNAREANELYRQAQAIYARHPELGAHYRKPFEDLQRDLRRR